MPVDDMQSMCLLEFYFMNEEMGLGVEKTGCETSPWKCVCNWYIICCKYSHLYLRGELIIIFGCSILAENRGVIARTLVIGNEHQCLPRVYPCTVQFKNMADCARARRIDIDLHFHRFQNQ